MSVQPHTRAPGDPRARLIAPVVLLSVLAGCSRSAPPTAAPAAPAVSVATVIERDIVEWDYFTGRTEAKETVEIRAQVSGYLDRVAFDEGGIVAAGDLLFLIDARPYEAARARALAEVRQAQARRDLAAIEARRAERLVARKVVAQEEFDRRDAELRIADAEVAAARARLAQAELDLSFTSIRAPIAGRVSRAYVTPGNFVEGGKESATRLAIVVSIDPLYVYYDVDERTVLGYRQLARDGKRPSARYARIPVRIGFASEKGYPHAAELDYAEPRLDPATGTVTVRAVLPNADDQLSPGMYARVQVPASNPYPALLVGDRAVLFDQGERFVYVVDAAGKVEHRKIDPGPQVEGLRVVRSGLKPGERIIVNGLQRVRPDIEVTAAEVPMPGDERAATSAGGAPAPSAGVGR
jgi:RND family efflux transporter MFP subunit